MAVRQDDDRRSWRVLQAALVLILCRDELRLPRKLRRRILRWMQRSPENLIHLFEIARVDQALDRLKLLDRSAQLAPSKRPPRGIPLPTRRAVLIGSAAAAALILGMNIPRIYDRNPPIRHLKLDDGSIMHVLRGSKFNIDFDDDVRLINLTLGEAVFEVAEDLDRPFIVRSSWSDSIAVGTRFGVVTDFAATTTTVSEGKVRVVAPAAADQTTGKVVHAGEEIRVAAGASRPEPAVAVNAERKISWSAGWLEFDGETVGEAVTTFNRFSEVQLEITQPELSGTRLSYTRFEIDKPESFAVAVGNALNVPVTLNSKRNVIYVGARRH